MRLPESEDVGFVRSRSGVVHVLMPEFDDPAAGGRDMTGADVMRFLLGSSVALCGRTILRNYGGVERSGHFTSDFDDADLCRGCYRATHPDDIARLFEHGRSEDA